MYDLEEKLKEYSDRPLKIGTFSAASNVTGILTDVNKVSALLHRYNALSFWDYATAGVDHFFLIVTMATIKNLIHFFGNGWS